MARQHIIEQVKHLKGRVHPVELISDPTPIHTINRFAKSHRHKLDILIKREDQTDHVYGGNKVRNLEYVLGEALYRKCNTVSTLIPYGSNFTGALAAQSKKLGLTPYLSQFVMQRNPQIEAHVNFGAKHGAQMKTFERKFGVAQAVADSTIHRLNPSRFYIAPGASNVLGALGHANALLEMVHQLTKDGKTIPDRIIVGAGTCGTIAGLVAGVALSGYKIKITGVRCAERIICNERKVRNLSSKLLKFAGTNLRPRSNSFEIVESPKNNGYAQITNGAHYAMEEFQFLEGIKLDTTYTSKVLMYMSRALNEGIYSSEKLLYWHTFSAAAMEET